MKLQWPQMVVYFQIVWIRLYDVLHQILSAATVYEVLHFV